MKAAKLGKVLIVDDDRFIRASIQNSISLAGFEISRSVSTVKEALNEFHADTADLALLDLDLGIGPTGVDLAIALRKINSQIGIIFLTTYQDPRFASVYNLQLPKGSRYLVKAEIDDFTQIVSVLLQTKHRPFHENVNHINKFEKLSDLQIEIWKEVSEGHSSSDIANRRRISEKAVEATLARIYLFLDIKKEKDNNPRILLANAFKKLSGKI